MRRSPSPSEELIQSQQPPAAATSTAERLFTQHENELLRVDNLITTKTSVRILDHKNNWQQARALNVVIENRAVVVKVSWTDPDTKQIQWENFPIGRFLEWQELKSKQEEDPKDVRGAIGDQIAEVL